MCGSCPRYPLRWAVRGSRLPAESPSASSLSNEVKTDQHCQSSDLVSGREVTVLDLFPNRRLGASARPSRSADLVGPAARPISPAGPFSSAAISSRPFLLF
jgi:hypothetical protein